MKTSGTRSDNKWYNEWKRVVQQVTTSDITSGVTTSGTTGGVSTNGITNDYKWQRVTMNDTVEQKMAMSDSEWQWVLKQMKKKESNWNRVILCFKMKQKSNLVTE